jgi:hypothetical protein
MTTHRRHTLLAAALVGVVCALAMQGGHAQAQQVSPPFLPECASALHAHRGIEDSIKPKVVYWAVAYGKGGKPESAVIDVEATEKVIPVRIEECKKAPKESFWQKMQAEHYMQAA